MQARYWRRLEAEQKEEANLGRRGHHNGWREPNEEFSYPFVSLGDVLRTLFGAELNERDLVWLSELLNQVLRFENGALIEAFLSRTPNKTDYRLAAEKLARVLHAMDAVMTEKGPATREWQQIALALGLPSCRYLQLTEKRIGRQFGLTPMAISRCVSKLLRLAELKPNGRGYNGTRF